MRAAAILPVMLVLAASFPLLAVRPAGASPTLLFDAYNGQVLYAEDADDLWYPASLTKIMTAYLAFEAIKAGKLSLDQKIPVSELAHAQPPSKVGMPVGGELSVELALQALIVKSANDVAVMLAEAIAGSEPTFVAQMNETAKRLGMTRTSFANPHGLPAPGQSTSARDLAKLSRVLIRDFPEHAHYWAMPDMRIGSIKLRTHNALLRTFEGADGIKTGFTCDAGFNVVASATRDNRKLIAVVLGQPNGQSRAIRAASLLEHGFANQPWKSLFGFSTIENMPTAGEARPLTSARSTVLSWSCGHRPKRKAVKAVKLNDIKAKVSAAKAKGKAKAGEAQPAGATPSANWAATHQAAPQAAPQAATQPTPVSKPAEPAAKSARPVPKPAPANPVAAR